MTTIKPAALKPNALPSEDHPIVIAKLEIEQIKKKADEHAQVTITGCNQRSTNLDELNSMIVIGAMGSSKAKLCSTYDLSEEGRLPKNKPALTKNVRCSGPYITVTIWGTAEFGFGRSYTWEAQINCTFKNHFKSINTNDIQYMSVRTKLHQQAPNKDAQLIQGLLNSDDLLPKLKEIAKTFAAKEIHKIAKENATRAAKWAQEAIERSSNARAAANLLPHIK